MAELPSLLAWPLLAGFIALPAAAAWWRRRVSREASAVAIGLLEFATAARGVERCPPLDDTLRARLIRLRVAEASSLQLAEELEPGSSATIADAAQRLSLRLRRRVAFQRKMLARTAPGLRRGAAAASLPPLLIVAAQWVGAEIPAGAQMVLLTIEAAGCALLWRFARVEI